MNTFPGLCSPEIPHINARLGLADIHPAIFRKKYPGLVLAGNGVMATCINGALLGEELPRASRESSGDATCFETFGIVSSAINNSYLDHEGKKPTLSTIRLVPSPATLRECMSNLQLPGYAYEPKYCSEKEGKFNTISAPHYAQHLADGTYPMSVSQFAEHDALLEIHALGMMLLDPVIGDRVAQSIKAALVSGETETISSIVRGFDSLTDRLSTFFSLMKFFRTPNQTVISQTSFEMKLLKYLSKSAHFGDFIYFFSSEAPENVSMNTALTQVLRAMDDATKHPQSKLAKQLYDFTRITANRIREVLNYRAPAE